MLLKQRVERQMNVVVEIEPNVVAPPQPDVGTNNGVARRTQLKTGVPKRLHAVLPALVLLPPKVVKRPLPKRT